MVHALPLSGPALVAAVVLALGKGLITCDAPLTREWARSARLCIRQHPAALGKTGQFGPLGGTAAAQWAQGWAKVVRWPAPAPAKRASTAPSWQWLVSYYRRQLPQAGFPNPRVGVAAWGPAALGLSLPPHGCGVRRRFR